MPTPETLTRHELVGLPVRVVDAPNPALVGIEGRVAAETERTLVVRGPTASGVRDRRVPKGDTQFLFGLPADSSSVADETAGGATVPPASGLTDEAADRRKGSGSAFELPWETLGTGSARPAEKSGGCEDVVYVTVDGRRLLSRPAFRTERAGDSTWQSD